MGLFTKKKSNLLQDNRAIPEFPRFPEMPQKKEVSYESSFTQQDGSIPVQTVKYNIPQPQRLEERTQPVLERRKWTDERNEVHENQDNRELMPQPIKPEMVQRAEIPVRESNFKPRMPLQTSTRIDFPQSNIENREMPKPLEVQEKPVFVKIERYREAMAEIDVLKQKLKETEYILDKLEDIRTQEQVELSNCHSNVNKIKEKLIEIDKKLFEI